MALRSTDWADWMQPEFGRRWWEFGDWTRLCPCPGPAEAATQAVLITGNGALIEGRAEAGAIGGAAPRSVGPLFGAWLFGRRSFLPRIRSAKSNLPHRAGFPEISRLE